MDNEAHALDTRKRKILITDDGLNEIAGLLELFDCYRQVYDIGGRTPFTPLRIKKPSQPPSEKPVELRDEYDLQRLRKAEEKRLKRAGKYKGASK